MLNVCWLTAPQHRLRQLHRHAKKFEPHDNAWRVLVVVVASQDDSYLVPKLFLHPGQEKLSGDLRLPITVADADAGRDTKGHHSRLTDILVGGCLLGLK